jgi:hypothetical protein
MDMPLTKTLIVFWSAASAGFSTLQYSMLLSFVLVLGCYSAALVLVLLGESNG